MITTLARVANHLKPHEFFACQASNSAINVVRLRWQQSSSCYEYDTKVA